MYFRYIDRIHQRSIEPGIGVRRRLRGSVCGSLLILWGRLWFAASVRGLFRPIGLLGIPDAFVLLDFPQNLLPLLLLLGISGPQGFFHIHLFAALQLLDDLAKDTNLGLCSSHVRVKVLLQRDHLDRHGTDEEENDNVECRRVPVLLRLLERLGWPEVDVGPLLLGSPGLGNERPPE